MKRLLLDAIILVVLLLICIFVVYGVIVISVLHEFFGWYKLKIGIILIGMVAFGFLTRTAWRQLNRIYLSYKAYRRNRPVKILHTIKSKQWFEQNKKK